jgi:hypothetical protein
MISTDCKNGITNETTNQTTRKSIELVHFSFSKQQVIKPVK